MPTPPEDVCRRWQVKGRVQGVGFRWFASKRAQQLGLAGWVRNLDDGSVEVVARGARQAMADMESALREGPRGARVSDLTCTDVPHELVEGKSFHVTH